MFPTGIIRNPNASSSRCSSVASKKRKLSAGESSPSRHAGERAYTRLVLPAGVQSNTVPRHQIPSHVQDAANLIDNYPFTSIISRSSAQSVLGSLRYFSPHELVEDDKELPVGAEDAAERAQKLWGKMSRFLGKTEPM